MCEKRCDRNEEFSNQYTLTENGLFVKNDAGVDVRVTWTWFRVKSRGRSANGKGWSYIVDLANVDGEISEVTIPSVDLLNNGSAALKTLANAGVEICPRGEKVVVDFIRGCRPLQRDLLVSECGYVDGRWIYVFPNQVIGGSGEERILYRPEMNSPTEKSICSSGTLDEWQENVALPAKGNPLLIFSILTALSSPMLRILELDGGGFNIYGQSSRGKTTALMAASSCFGNGSDPASSGNSYIRRWNVTSNAVEALGAAHNDSFLALDELGSGPDKGFDALVYNLTGGQGKAAMNSSRNLREQRTWTCHILSSGEVSFRSKIEAGGGRVMAGQMIRMIDLPVGDSIILETHGLDPAEFVNKLKKACSTYYGTAGPDFITQLLGYLKEDEEVRSELLRELEKHTSELTPDGIQPEQARGLRRFGLLAVTGIAAIQLEVLPFTEDEVLASVKYARDCWLAGSMNDVSDTDRAIQALRSFIISNHSVFVGTRNGLSKTSNIKGFINVEMGWYLFDGKQLKTAIGGYDIKVTLRALRDKNLLVIHEPGRMKIKQKIARLGDQWIRFYAVKSAIVGANFDAEDDNDESSPGQASTDGIDTIDL